MEADKEAEQRTLWMGELDSNYDESYLTLLWASYGQSVNVKLIKDRYSGLNAGYAFVEFPTKEAAETMMTSLNNTPIPNTNKVFRLNWASGGGINDKRAPEYSVFVGDLGQDVNDELLLATFQQQYSSIKSAKVVMDPTTGHPRGYGFVRFLDETEQQRALTEMQGVQCGSRPMRISLATPKHGYAPYSDPMNTTVFVGGLAAQVVEDDLRALFSPFGHITSVKIPAGKGCGFVTFIDKASAESSISQLHGYSLGGSRLRLSWGKSHARSSLPVQYYDGLPVVADGFGLMMPPAVPFPLGLPHPPPQ